MGFAALGLGFGRVLYPDAIRTFVDGYDVDGYCSTVQGLLDWFEVDFHEQESVVPRRDTH